jgi:hypothetical protein
MSTHRDNRNLPRRRVTQDPTSEATYRSGLLTIRCTTDVMWLPLLLRPSAADADALRRSSAFGDGWGSNISAGSSRATFLSLSHITRRCLTNDGAAADLGHAISSCEIDPDMSRPQIRIAVLHFSHETVTFLKNDTTLNDFIYPGSPAKGEELLSLGAKCYMGGFVKVAREFDGVELVGIESPLWPKTGIGSGWVTTEAYETLVGKMLVGIKVEGPFDGVYLCLHGAMAVRGVPRPEAELARRVREAVGARAPIAATFDLHGNEDEVFLRYADLAFAVKYFPHYDAYLQGERAARILVRAIRGDYKPAHVTVKVPIISLQRLRHPLRRARRCGPRRGSWSWRLSFARRRIWRQRGAG